MNSATLVIADKYEEGLLADLVNLHQAAFAPHMRLPEPVKYFTEGLKDPDSINIVLQSSFGKVVGHLLAFPQSSVYEELRQWDPIMEDNPKGLYLDMIHVLPGQRKLGGATRLFGRMAEEAERRNFSTLSMHARTSSGMDKMIQRLFPSNRCLRRIENWLDTGESVEYIETTTEFASR